MRVGWNRINRYHAMIPCDLRTDQTSLNHRGWPLHTCHRCGRSWNMRGTPDTWKGDPVWCREWPRWFEFGYWAILLLASFGVTPRRWAWVQWKLGLIEVPASSCVKCEARKRWLNSFGGRLAQRTDWLGKLLCRWLVKRSKPPSTPSASGSVLE